MVAEPCKVCSFDHSGMKWGDSGCGGYGVRSCGAFHQDRTFICISGGRVMVVSFALEDPSPALGVGNFRESKRKFWIIPISVLSVAGQAQVIEMPYPGVIVGGVPLSRLQVANAQGKKVRSSPKLLEEGKGKRDGSPASETAPPRL